MDFTPRRALERLVEKGLFKTPEDLVRVDELLSSDICWHCEYNGTNNPGTLRTQNTAYTDEIRNYVVLCDSCAEINEEYWDDMWKEYYSGVL